MPRHALSKDSLEYEKRGRLLRDEHGREVAQSRAAELLSSRGGGGTGRSATLSTVSSPGASALKLRSRELVLKIVSWSKDARPALSQALYAGQARDGDPPDRALTMG